MAITLQRAVAASSASAGASQTMAVQVDSGTNLGLLVAVFVGGGVSSTSTATYNGTSMTLIGADNAAGYGSVSWFYTANPAVGTLNVVATPSASRGTRIQAWVLEGAHQSTAPTFLLGTGGVTTTWSWTSTVGAFIAFGIKRGGTVTWTVGGGGTQSSSASLVSTGGSGGIDTAAAGYLIADATSEAPTYTLSGGDSSTNTFGSVQWLEDPGGTLTFSTQPENAWDGEVNPVTLVVTSSDSGSTATVTLTKKTGSGTLSGVSAAAMVAGSVSFAGAIITGSGAHTLAANATGHVEGVSDSFKVATGTGIPGGASSYTEADMQYDNRPRSGASLTGEVLILSTDGTPATGKIHSDITCYASTDGSTPTSVTLQTMTIGTYASGGLKELAATNRPGWYAFGYPTLPSSGNRRVFTFTGTGLRSASIIVDLTADDLRAAGLTDTGIADTLLNRDMSTGTDSGSTTVRTVRQALRSIRNRFSSSGSIVTIYKEDDSTPSHTVELTGSPAVTEANPAGGS